MIRFASIPRPSLNWMSPNDVLSVRNKLAGLCYPKGQYFVEMIDGQEIEVYPGFSPRFVYPAEGEAVAYAMWLKLRPDRLPYWDVVGLGGQIGSVAFNHKLIPKEPAMLIKRWLKKFPYAVHDESLVNKGECIV